MEIVEILERVWWKLDRSLDEDVLRSAAQYYVSNALLAGTTTLIVKLPSPFFVAPIKVTS